MTQPAHHNHAPRAARAFPLRSLLFVLPFALLLAYGVWWHLQGNLTSGDDPIFATALGWLSLPAWLVQRWTTWTSRLLLEIPLVLVARSPAAFALWTGVSCVCLLLIALCLLSFSRRPTPLHAAAACLLTALLWTTSPMDSGYLTMSAVYLWPMAALCVCLLPLRSEKRPAWSTFTVGFLCCVYASNNEQFCVLLLLIFGVSAALRAKRTGRAAALYATVCAALCAAMLFVQLLCPGNAARKAANYAWFVDYDMLTLPQKLEMGASGTVGGMFLTPALTWGLFFVLLAVTGFVCLRGALPRLMCSLPVAAWLVLGVLPPFLPQPLRGLLTLSTRLTQHGSVTLENHANPFTYVFPALMLCLAFCLLAAVYVAFGHTPRAAVALGLLLAGFAARMTLIFSPSVWVSGSRTHLILNLCCHAVCILLLDEIFAQKSMVSLHKRG